MAHTPRTARANVPRMCREGPSVSLRTTPSEIMYEKMFMLDYVIKFSYIYIIFGYLSEVVKTNFSGLEVKSYIKKT